MVWRLAVSCSLAVLLALQPPARADGPGPVAPLSPAPTAAQNGAPARARRNTALVLLVAGGALALTTVFFGVRARREHSDMDPDGGLLDGAIASVAFWIAVPTLGVGIGLMLPDDGSPRPPASSYPRVAQLPRGLELRLTF